MAPTDINSEDRLVQQTFAEHLEKALAWESIYAYNAETFGPAGTLGRAGHGSPLAVGRKRDDKLYIGGQEIRL